MDLRLKQAPVIWLAGFMGSGKSTAGKLLAKKLGWSFVDLDAEIERTAGKRIAEIFAEQGEDAFRDLEHQQLLSQVRISRQGGACVVALGGGAYAAQVLRVSDLLAGPSLPDEPTAKADARVVSVVLTLTAAQDLRLGERVLVRFTP